MGTVNSSLNQSSKFYLLTLRYPSSVTKSFWDLFNTKTVILLVYVCIPEIQLKQYLIPQPI